MSEFKETQKENEGNVIDQMKKFFGKKQEKSDW